MEMSICIMSITTSLVFVSFVPSSSPFLHRQLLVLVVPRDEEGMLRGSVPPAASITEARCNAAMKEIPSTPATHPTSHVTTTHLSMHPTDSAAWCKTDHPAASGSRSLSPPRRASVLDGIGQTDTAALKVGEPPRESRQSPPSSSRSFSSPAPSQPAGFSASPHGIAALSDDVNSTAPSAGMLQPKPATTAYQAVRRPAPFRSSLGSSLPSASPPSGTFRPTPDPTAASARAVAEVGDDASEEKTGLVEQLAVGDNDDNLEVALKVIESLLQEKDAAEGVMAKKMELMALTHKEALQSAERESAERATADKRSLAGDWTDNARELNEQKAELEIALRQKEEGEGDLRETQAELRQTEERLALAYARYDSLSQSAAAQAATTLALQRAQDASEGKLEEQLKVIQAKAQEDAGHAQVRYDSLFEIKTREAAAARERASQELRAVQDAAEEKIEDAARAQADFSSLQAHTTEQLAEAHEATREMAEVNKKMELEAQQVAVKLEASVRSRDYALMMLGKQGQLKAESIKEAEHLKQELAAAQSDHAAALAEAREATAANRLEHQEALRRSSQEIIEANQQAEEAVDLAEEVERRMADRQAAADIEIRSLREQTATVDDRLILLRDQEKAAATAASEHAKMLEERISMLGEELAGMAARTAENAALATAAKSRTVAAESRAVEAETRVMAAETHATAAESRAVEAET
ncbi:unnamed protein product, partial [Hapterophycus canaliculatus]